MTKIAVLGAGIMASALTFPLADNGHEVNIIGTHLDDHIIDAYKKHEPHPTMGVALEQSVKPFYFTEVEQGFEGAEVVMVGVNSFGVEWVGEQLSKLLKPGQKVIVITKGMRADEDGTLHILPDVMKKLAGPVGEQVSWNAIVGPSIAGELAVKRDTAVNFTGKDQADLDFLAELFRTSYYHVWTDTDFIGNETGAATKNIYAFAAGFATGVMKAKKLDTSSFVMFNYSAALFGQGSVELHQFIELLGGDPKTGDGLGGVGDMYVTSMGGRNVKAGGFVGEGIAFSEVRDVHMKGVTLEGVAAIREVGAALEKLTERGVIKPEDFPLCRFLYDLVAKDAALDIPWDKFFGGKH